MTSTITMQPDPADALVFRLRAQRMYRAAGRASDPGAEHDYTMLADTLTELAREAEQGAAS